MLNIAVFLLIAVSVFFLANALFTGLGVGAQRVTLREDIHRRATTIFTKEAKPMFSLPGLKPLSFLAKPFYNLSYLANLKRQSEVLMINIDLEGLVLLKVFCGLIIGLLVFFFFMPLYAPLGLFIGFFLPDFVMIRKIRNKKEEITRIFPESVDLLDMCINAGADFVSAIRWLIDKSEYNPFIEQLGIVLSEIQVGKPRSEALKDMAKRIQIPEVSSFVRMITQAERMGTSIEEAFRNLSEDTRNLRFQMGERYAVKASLKIIFPLIFCILPAILIVVAGPIIIKFTSGELIPKGY